MAKQNEVESPHRGGTFGCKLGGMNSSRCDSVQEQRFPPGSDQSPGWASEHPQDVGALNTEVNARNHENTQTPTTKIRPLRESGWLDVEEIWSFRDLLWSLAARDLKLRYRQTALGVLWVVFQPLAGAGIFTVVFGWVAGLKSGKLSYFLFSLAGLLVWNAFQSTLGKASMALLGNTALVSKVYFPRLLLPLSTVLSSLVDFLIGLLVFAVSSLVLNSKVSWPGILMLPVWLGAALSAAIGIGLLASAVMTRFRDVQHILPVLLPFLLYASPVAYALDAIPEQWRAAFHWNPMSWVLEGTRASLLASDAVSFEWAVYSIGSCMLILLVGVIGFKQMERSFADVL
jgi:lipopolysaccharide transport system permease protein